MESVIPYDAIVIGTGQAGKPLASSLAKSGRRTAILERDDKVGGTCVVRGCTPTKTMVASARVAHLTRRGADYGVVTGDVRVELEKVRERKRNIVELFSGGGRKGLERQEGLDLIFGEGRFIAPKKIEVAKADGEKAVLTAPEIFLNVGARPRIPNIPGLSDVPFLDSTSIMELGRVPEHLVVIGGGYIAAEFGQMFRRFGARVTLVQRGAQILSREDEDVASEMASILEGEGIEILLEAEIDSISRDGEASTSVEIKSPGGARTLQASELLVAVGRVPNTDRLNVQAAGLELDGNGFLSVNDRLETNVEGIYALGDVNGGPAFTHISYDDFRVVENQLLGDATRTTRDRILPYCIFTDPELGRVGLSEREAEARAMDVRVVKLPMSRAARALESDETRGFMKALVDPDSHRILGAAVLSVHGGEVMTVLQMAMLGGVTASEVRDGVFAHPTLAESLNNLFKTL